MAEANKGFSQEDDEKLIEEVRKFPNLYNSSLAEYRDHHRTEQSWIAIAKLFGSQQWNVFRDRWKYLRDQYTKYKKIANESKSGDAGGKKLKKWKYFDLMDFLKDHIKHRSTSGNVSR